MELRLEPRLSQKLFMTPQLQQAIKLLQLSRLELQQVLSQHLSENFLLEEDDDLESEEESVLDKKEVDRGEEEKEETRGEGPTETAEDSESILPEEWDNYYQSDWREGAVEYPSSTEDEYRSYEQTLTNPTSLEDHLLWQLQLSSLSQAEKSIGRILIGNLDDNGYLTIPIAEIAETEQVSLDMVESVLRQVQTFDPPGVSARDLSECLMIQFRHLAQDPIGSDCGSKGALNEALIESIVAYHLSDLEKKRYGNIAKALGVTIEEVYEAVHLITGLEPKPGRPYCSDGNQVIVPDVFVFKNEGEWVVLLNDDGLPRLRINQPYYQRLMANNMGEPASTKAYLDEKLRGAQWIIRSIDQRHKTIVKVVKSLVKFQEQFLEQGKQHLKPLILRQVAEDVELHESTISRVTTNKYMHCPQGIFELKFFFNAGIQRTAQHGADLSSITVIEIIREMVAQEDPRYPLKDQDIAAKLRSRDISIARRTVAKYRAEVRIPAASQRKSLPRL